MRCHNGIGPIKYEDFKRLSCNVNTVSGRLHGINVDCFGDLYCFHLRDKILNNGESLKLPVFHLFLSLMFRLIYMSLFRVRSFVIHL